MNTNLAQQRENKGGKSPRKEASNKSIASHISSQAFETTSVSSGSALSPGSSDTLVVVVMPCGREDGKNSQDEMPYEIRIRKKANENSLKEIFLRKPQYWEKIFKQHLEHETQPNFSIYRKPFEPDQDPSKSELYLHILYMKSSEKALSRNYNAQELELFCHNRFYGPLVVAYNVNKQPYFLSDFSLEDLQEIEQINRNFQNKSIKDDYVPECLLEFSYLQCNLMDSYSQIGAYAFYMFKYKTAWCPNKKDSHDSKSCIYAHHTRDFRRPPELFKYLPEDCETLIKGLGWDKCEKGLKCNKCHTTVERLYHPDKYKRIYCDRGRCNKSEICAFFHTNKEKQVASRDCKAYKKSQEQMQLPDVENLCSELFKYYQNQNCIELGTASQIKTQQPQITGVSALVQNQSITKQQFNQIEDEVSISSSTNSSPVVNQSPNAKPPIPSGGAGSMIDEIQHFEKLSIQSPDNHFTQLKQSPQIEVFAPKSQSMKISRPTQAQALFSASPIGVPQTYTPANMRQPMQQYGFTHMSKPDSPVYPSYYHPHPNMAPQYTPSLFQPQQQQPQISLAPQPYPQQMLQSQQNPWAYPPPPQPEFFQPQQTQGGYYGHQSYYSQQRQFQHLSHGSNNIQPQMGDMPFMQQIPLMPKSASCHQKRLPPHHFQSQAYQQMPQQQYFIEDHAKHQEMMFSSMHGNQPQIHLQPHSIHHQQIQMAQGAGYYGQMQHNIFDYPETDGPMTRTSTYSKASVGLREEINQNSLVYPFVDEQKPAYLVPVDEQAEDYFNSLAMQHQKSTSSNSNQKKSQEQKSSLDKQLSGKSPTHGAHGIGQEITPVLLDFLEDDSIFLDQEASKRIKSKTEFVRRERVESGESAGGNPTGVEYPLQSQDLSRDAQAYFRIFGNQFRKQQELSNYSRYQSLWQQREEAEWKQDRSAGGKDRGKPEQQSQFDGASSV